MLKTMQWFGYVRQVLTCIYVALFPGEWRDEGYICHHITYMEEFHKCL